MKNQKKKDKEYLAAVMGKLQEVRGGNHHLLHQYN